MQLISQHHDYYDSVFKTSSVDDKYKFIRETKTVPCKDMKLYIPVIVQDSNTHNTIELKFGFIGFCGTIHPFIRVTPIQTFYASPPRTLIRGDKYEYFYTLNALNAAYPFVTSGKAKLPYWSSVRIKNIKSWLNDDIVLSYFLDEDHINVCKSDKTLNLFNEHRVSYFSYLQPDYTSNKPTLTLYPILKAYQFYTVYDTFTAFQMIEHHQTNELVRPDLIEHKISDKLKAETHGFDKWSFRKEKKK